MKIAVYCASASDLPQEFINVAKAAGEWIGANDHTLIYGGVNAGLMHVVAEETHRNGGKVVGVVPERFKHCADPIADVTILSQDLSDRKAIMIATADAFLVLPGGIGTIDEWLSTVSQMKVDGNAKPVIVANVNGIFSPTLAQIELTRQGVLVGGGNVGDCAVAEDEEQLINELNKL